MSYKPIDGSKEEFRRYLDRKGVLDSLTKVMLKCYYDRPDNALEFLLENMGDTVKSKDTIDKLQEELKDAYIEIDKLKKQLAATNWPPTPSAIDASTNDDVISKNESNTIIPVEHTEDEEQSAIDPVAQHAAQLPEDMNKLAIDANNVAVPPAAAVAVVEQKAAVETKSN